MSLPVRMSFINRAKFVSNIGRYILCENDTLCHILHFRNPGTFELILLSPKPEIISLTRCLINISLVFG